MSISLNFLGSGAGLSPTLSRACSAAVLNIGGASCLIDCAEGTHLQFARFKKRLSERNQSPLISQTDSFRRSILDMPRPRDINKIFITHMHLDHCMGLPVFLRDILAQNRTNKKTIDIFGPVGLRELVRTVFRLTQSSTTTAARYRIHELITAQENPTPCDEASLHMHEIPGSDIWCDSAGHWANICETPSFKVSAASIVHRVQCFGYVFSEQQPNPRKVVMLGDTSDASGIRVLAQNANILVHEATMAHIPMSVNSSAGRPTTTPSSVEEKAVSRGHSTPAMAGAFAASIKAQYLALNHFSARYPDKSSFGNVISEIERQATEAWGSGTAKAVKDFSTLVLPEKGSAEWIDI